MTLQDMLACEVQLDEPQQSESAGPHSLGTELRGGTLGWAWPLIDRFLIGRG